jgi:hypothetical protein
VAAQCFFVTFSPCDLANTQNKQQLKQQAAEQVTAPRNDTKKPPTESTPFLARRLFYYNTTPCFYSFKRTAVNGCSVLQVVEIFPLAEKYYHGPLTAGSDTLSFSERQFCLSSPPEGVGVKGATPPLKPSEST